MPIRIYALAKDLKIDSKELVEFCNKAGIPGKGSALASLEDDEIAKLKTWMDASATKRQAERPGPAGRYQGRSFLAGFRHGDAAPSAAAAHCARFAPRVTPRRRRSRIPPLPAAAAARRCRARPAKQPHPTAKIAEVRPQRSRAAESDAEPSCRAAPAIVRRHSSVSCRRLGSLRPLTLARHRARVAPLAGSSRRRTRARAWRFDVRPAIQRHSRARREEQASRRRGRKKEDGDGGCAAQAARASRPRRSFCRDARGEAAAADGQGRLKKEFKSRS